MLNVGEKGGHKNEINNDGNNNVNNIFNIIVNGNNQEEVLKKAKDLQDQVIGTLGAEVGNDDYRVLAFRPSDSECDIEEINIINGFLSDLEKNGVEVLEGGKLLEETGEAYTHIADIKYVEENECDCVVFFAKDVVTFSQFSLLSHVKFGLGSDKIDMIVVPSDEVLSSFPYLKDGPVNFCDDNGGKVYYMSELKLKGFGDVVRLCLR